VKNRTARESATHAQYSCPAASQQMPCSQ